MWGWPSEYQSWTWPGEEGKQLQVSVYTRCTSVRLELNGKVIGEQKVDTDPVVKPKSFAAMMSGAAPKLQLTATFNVPYAPGELKAVGLADGKEVATKILKSAGKPASIRLTPDRGTIRADRNDLSFVTVEITDEAGNLVPNAEIPVQLSVTGDGELQASGNAAPNDMKSFRKAKCTTFQGRCLAIVRPFSREGSINVSVTAEGLPAQSIEIKTKQSGM